MTVRNKRTFPVENICLMVKWLYNIMPCGNLYKFKPGKEAERGFILTDSSGFGSVKSWPCGAL